MRWDSGKGGVAEEAGDLAPSGVQVKQEPKAVLAELKGLGSVAGSMEECVWEKVRELMGAIVENLLSKYQEVPRVLETLKIVKEAAEKMMNRMSSSIPEMDAPKVQQKYKLKFGHKCLALGCMEPKCDLCEANPRRRCRSDFDKKYFKGDILKAKCGGNIYVELVDAETEQRVLDPELDRQISMSILDGNRYDHLFPHAAPQFGGKGLEMCALLTGNEGRPLLHSQDRTANKPDGQIVVTLQNGVAMLPDLSVQYSSEALLSGRRPPFRLLVQLVTSGQHDKAVVNPAVSDGFVVASGRSRLAQKKHIPSVDDPVSRLENMGKERVKKLRDLRGTACSMGVDLPEGQHWTIIKVGDFRMLALNADKDGQLRQKMLHILKMSEKAWDETRDHALMAVTNDTRMRAWYRASSSVNGNVGLVYSCYLGAIDLDRAVALIDGDEVHLKEHLTPDQRNSVRILQKEANDCWWRPGHPGWTFYPFDSESFKQSPSLLTPPKKDYGKTISMEISRQDPNMVKFSKSETLPGRPLVPVLQSTPLSNASLAEDTRDREEFGESNKRIRMDRMKSQGDKHNIRSPFEEAQRQLSVLKGVTSLNIHGDTTGKRIVDECAPETHDNFGCPARGSPSQIDRIEKDASVLLMSCGSNSHPGKETRRTGFEVQKPKVLNEFEQIFYDLRQNEDQPEDTVRGGRRQYGSISSESTIRQELRDQRLRKSCLFHASATENSRGAGTSAVGLSPCILSDDVSDGFRVERKARKVDDLNLDTGRGKKMRFIPKSQKWEPQFAWQAPTMMAEKRKGVDHNLDLMEESNVSCLTRAPKRRVTTGVDRHRAGQSLEIPPSLSQR